MGQEINLDDSMDEILDGIEAKDDADEDLTTTQEEDEDGDVGEPEESGGDSEDVGAEDGDSGIQEGQGGDEVTVGQEEEKLDPTFELAPTGWDGESKAKYAELPAWVKKQAHKREQDMLKGVNQLKEQLRGFDPINQIVGDYRAYLSAKNVTPVQALKDALNLSYSLSTATPQQRAVMLRGIAEQYGADMAMLGQQPDPATLQHQQAVQPLVNEINQLKQHLFGQQEQQRRQQTDEAVKTVEQFRSEVDEKGALKYPFFERVQEDMAVLIESGRATTLQDAYDKAVWTDPDIRQLIQKTQNAELEKQRQEDAKAKAAKAKKAQRVNLGSSGQPDAKAKKPTGTIDDTMDEILDKAYG